MTIAISLLVMLVALILTVVAGMTLWWMLHAWRTPATFEAIHAGVRGEPQLSFSLIVPCRDESQQVMEETIRRLLAQDHPDFEVIISLGHDDLPTIAAAQNIVDLYPHRVRISINSEDRKSKPVPAQQLIAGVHQGGGRHYRRRKLDRPGPASPHRFDLSVGRRPTSSRGPFTSSTCAVTGSACATAWSTGSGSALDCTVTPTTALCRWVETRCSSGGTSWKRWVAGILAAWPRMPRSACGYR